MAKVIVGTTMSLDGFINDRDGSVSQLYSDFESVIRQAKAAAGDKDITVVGGASISQQILRAGLADELHIDIMPVLLAAGLRFFDNLGDETIQLEKIDVVNVGTRTSLRFRVVVMS